jgi:hypothetical protein
MFVQTDEANGYEANRSQKLKRGKQREKNCCEDDGNRALHSGASIRAPGNRADIYLSLKTKDF